MAALHAEVSIEVEEVWLVLAVGKDIIEESIRCDAISTMGGTSSEEAEMKSITSGEYECVSMGLGFRFRGIPNFSCYVISMSLIFIRENLVIQEAEREIERERERERGENERRDTPPLRVGTNLISSVNVDELLLGFRQSVLVRVPGVGNNN